MYNGWEHYSPRQGSESYPTPAPSPQVDDDGVPLPPGAPKFHTIPLPPTCFGTLHHLHPILRYANCPCIQYDVMQRPNYASATHARLEWAHESVTNPPSSQVIITCQVLPHPFIVHPSGRSYDFVTVHDILLAVHRAFIEAIREAEARCNLSSWTRRQDDPATALWSSGHCTRSIVLSGRHTWKGISEEIAPGNWLLHIE